MNIAGAALAMLLVVTLAACASSSSQTEGFVADAYAAPEPPPANATGDYHIGVYDRVRVTVFRMPDLGMDGQVNSKGQFVMPLVGAIDAAGKTEEQFARDITVKLSEDVRNPSVTVTVLEKVSQTVTVAGAVKDPGVYAVNNGATLLQVITRAKGVAGNADVKNIGVVRTLEGGRSIARFDLNAIGRGSVVDPYILPGDKIVVENSRAKSAWSQVLSSLPVLGIFTAF